MKILNAVKGYKMFTLGALTFLAPVLTYLLSILQNADFNETLIRVLALFHVTADPTQVGAYVMAAVGLLVMVLRAVTSTAMFRKA